MIIDGKTIAQKILSKLSERVAGLPQQPVFCDVLVGDDPVSASYVKMKAATARKIGIKFRTANFPAEISASELIAAVRRIASEPQMCGLIIQLPLPPGLPRQEILDSIEPAIDVDCMGGDNLRKFYQGRPRFMPPTSAAILHILDTLNVPLETKKFLMLGQGELVGKPVAFLLRQRGYRADSADQSTANTQSLLKAADVVISATGQPKLLTGPMLKPGAIVIDAGTAESGGGIVGDVDSASVRPMASALSTVPGGVGPVTVAMLLNNVILAAQNKLAFGVPEFWLPAR